MVFDRLVCKLESEESNIVVEIKNFVSNESVLTVEFNTFESAELMLEMEVKTAESKESMVLVFFNVFCKTLH